MCICYSVENYSSLLGKIKDEWVLGIYQFIQS